MMKYRALLKGKTSLNGSPIQTYGMHFGQIKKWAEDIINSLTLEEQRSCQVTIFETSEMPIEIIVAAPETVAKISVVPRKGGE